MISFKQIFDLSLKQQFILTVILILEIIGAGIFFYVSKIEDELMITNDFIATSKELTASIEKEISLNLETLKFINALYDVNNTISREQFKVFNTNVLDRITSIKALEWIPLVKLEDLTNFESFARKEGISDFQITEKLGDSMVPVENRSKYYPVFYVEPLKGNEKAVGFDLGSDEIRFSAIQKAIKTNNLVATSRTTLVQEESSQKGVLVFNPVKKKGQIIGFVLGVYRIGDLITRAIGDLPNNNCNLIIYDTYAEEGNQLLAELNVENHDPILDNSVIIKPNGVYFEQTIKIADREWLIISTPTKSYLNSFTNTTRLSLFFIIILSIVMLYYFYRNFREFNQQEKNQVLLEKAVNERTEELQEYAHVVSHDLKSPLRNIEALVSWIKDDNRDNFDENSLKNFDYIESTLEKMELLITNILGYSSINIRLNKIQEVDLNTLITNLKLTLFIPKNVSINVLSKLPVIKGDKIKLHQLFQNLLSNAIKFNSKEHGIIEIDVLDKKSFYQFSIKDNGIGIDKKYHKKIFQIFQVLNQSKTSTGIGLAIVKKIVAHYHGEIWVKSKIGKGSTFYFTIKK